MAEIGQLLREQVRHWISRDPDPETRTELEDLLASDSTDELSRRFAGRLAFGTAGLRGEMGAGPTRMNRLVVRQSAAGIARYLIAEERDARARGVVIAHDARHRSPVFAADCAEVLAGHGFRVVAADRPLPTPVGVHAIRQMRAAAGIVVTASHNPPHDNGLKLYMGDGAQIIPPVDAGIASAIGAVAVDGVVVPPDTPPGVIDSLPDAVVEDYVRATLARVPAASEPLSLAVTAMHGVGGALLVRVLHEAGFSHVAPVPEQQEPDPDFPTVGFPNPEEPGATALLARTMTESGASLGLALDPDADRVAALVGAGGEAVPLTGDEVGALLAEWLLAEVTEGAGRLVVASVVSSQLLRQIAAHHGAAYAETLTGFKWLCRPAMDDPSARQVLAYEEALGYAIGLDARDKDGISAALGLASMASALAARGQTLLDALDEIHLRHGAHVTENFSLRDDRPGATARRDAAVTALHESPPEEIAGEPVEGVEIVVEGVLGVRLAPGVRILIRPSGTEPKLKCYCEAVERATRRDALPEARERARRRLSRVRDALTGLLVS